MTSAQTMLTPRPRAAAYGRRFSAVFLVLAAAALGSFGCETMPLGDPEQHESPFLPQRMIVGVAPILNESGVSIVDGLRVADAMQHKTEEVIGFHAVAVNRVALAMRQLDLGEISTPAEARTVMRALDLDALITGVVTTWDEYRPFRLGLALDWYVRDAPSGPALDPRELAHRPGLPAAPGEIGPAGPAARASRLFDASNHLTLKWVRNYADARSEPASAYGSDAYLVSMDLYTEFACHRLLGELLAQESQRLAAAERHR